jgi:Flp pilus assembly protein TadD
LLPAHHVVSTFTIPVEQFWHEVRSLLDPPPPFSATAYRQEAASAMNQGDLNRAETLATIATRLAPDALSHNLRGVVMARQGRWADALQEFDAAVLVDPLMTDALMNRARARAARGDLAGARQDAHRVQDQSSPQSPLATQAAEFLDATGGRAP